MMAEFSVNSMARIQNDFCLIRSQKVMLSTELLELYGG